MAETSGIDLLLAAYAALSPAEQEQAEARLSERRLARLAAETTETARLIAALRQVRDTVAGEPTVDDYKRVWRERRDTGEPFPGLHEQLKHFRTWRRAKEALELGELTSERMIEERFRKRRLGKIWRFTEQTLRETLARCVNDLGTLPLVADFDAWRQREHELARARGDKDFHLPSYSPYWKRYGTWENALLHFGYEPDDVQARLEEGQQRRRAGLEQTTLRWASNTEIQAKKRATNREN